MIRCILQSTHSLSFFFVFGLDIRSSLNLIFCLDMLSNFFLFFSFLQNFLYLLPRLKSLLCLYTRQLFHLNYMHHVQILSFSRQSA